MIKSLILMLQFFTRLPIPLQIDMDKRTISRGILFFPLVGMLTGLISWVAYFILGFISTDAAALGAVFGAVVVTGGLHIDGLSDTCDGFFSARSRERILEIMKDSRVGSFGVIAIVLDLLSRYVLVGSLPQREALLALVLISGASRLGAAYLITFGKTARPGGLGEMFSSSSNRVYFIISAVLYTALGAFLGGYVFLITLGVMMGFCLVVMGYSYKIIGGLTGDVYGAYIELSEIIGLVALMGALSWI